MRNAAITTLTELAGSNQDIMLLSGDLGYGVLTEFIEKYPKQYLNMGICEQNMTSVAAGLALEGKIVFTYSIANFPILRCYEQLRNDVAYHNANVKVISVGSGFGYGSLGMSHHASEDISAMRCMPNMVVFSPGDRAEASAVMRLAVAHDGPCYIRLGKSSTESLHASLTNIEIGKALEIHNGTDACIMATGSAAAEAKTAYEQLEQMGISAAMYTFPTIKPFDKETVIKCAEQFSVIVTVEDNNIIGGLGSAVAEIMAQQKCKAVLRMVGMNDCFASVVGDRNYLHQYYGISASAIVDAVKTVI